MCNSEIVLYPDKVLRTQTQDVVDFFSEDFLSLVANLQNTMDSYEHCVGLAANQIGSNLNVFVADASKNKKAESKYGNILVVNAKILLQEGMEVGREGCMSVPDLTGNVHRARHIELMGQNEFGETITLKAFDFEARVFQHEIDHLNGKVFLDRVHSSRDVFSRKRYK